MKTHFLKSFARDLKAVSNARVRKRIEEAVTTVETAERPEDVKHLKKLAGTDNYFRIRVGDFRIGIAVVEGDVVFVRCLHRKDIYRYFP